MRIVWWLLLPLLAWSFEGTLIQIVDGDTVVLKDQKESQTICQLGFLDAPEDRANARLASQATRCGLSQALLKEAGIEATAFIKSTLVLGETYTYELLSPRSNGWAHCLIHIPKAAHAQLHPTINGVMLDQGYGVFSPCPENPPTLMKWKNLPKLLTKKGAGFGKPTHK
ncbi:MAG: hypothetical protein IBX45_05015 [Campylobacterales bacterium]|nr:hypothetical protein [Campylobacterales bacterium]